MALTNQGQENSFASGIFGTQMQGYGANLNYNANMADLSAKIAGQLGSGIGSGISSLPFLQGGGGSNPGGLLGQLGAFGDITGAGTAAGAAGAAGALGTSAGAAAFAGTGGIDALLAEGAPLLLVTA